MTVQVLGRSVGSLRLTFSATSAFMSLVYLGYHSSTYRWKNRILYNSEDEASAYALAATTVAVFTIL